MYVMHLMQMMHMMRSMHFMAYPSMHSQLSHVASDWTFCRTRLHLPRNWWRVGVLEYYYSESVYAVIGAEAAMSCRLILQSACMNLKKGRQGGSERAVEVDFVQVVL